MPMLHYVSVMYVDLQAALVLGILLWATVIVLGCEAVARTQFDVSYSDFLLRRLPLNLHAYPSCIADFKLYVVL